MTWRRGLCTCITEGAVQSDTGQKGFFDSQKENEKEKMDHNCASVAGRQVFLWAKISKARKKWQYS